MNMDYDDEEAQIAEAIRLSLEESQSSASRASPPLLVYERFLVPPLAPSIPQQPKPSILIDLTDDDKIVKVEGEKTFVRKLVAQDASEDTQPKPLDTHTFNNTPVSYNSSGATPSNGLIDSYQGRIMDSYRDGDGDSDGDNLDGFIEDMDTSFMSEGFGHSQSSSNPNNNGDEDEDDEDLKMALALSLREASAQHLPEPSYIQASNGPVGNNPKAKPKRVEASPLISLDREQMERERLARIRKRDTAAVEDVTDTPKKYRIHEVTPEPIAPPTVLLPPKLKPATISISSTWKYEQPTMDHPSPLPAKVYPRRSKKAVARTPTPTSPSSHIPPVSKNYPSSPPSMQHHITSPKSPSAQFPSFFSSDPAKSRVKPEPQETSSSSLTINSGTSTSFSGFPRSPIKTEPSNSSTSSSLPGFQDTRQSRIKVEPTNLGTSSSFSRLSESAQPHLKIESQELKLPMRAIANPDHSTSSGPEETFLPRFNTATFRNTWIKGTIPGNFEIRIEDLLVKEHIVKAVMTTYKLNEKWLSKYLPRHITQCLVVHWDKKCEEASEPGFNTIDKVTTVHPPLNGFGTFHPKLMLIFYPTFCRVVVSSANLEDHDWSLIVNTVYVQDFALLPVPVDSPEELGPFGSALHNYLQVMALPDKVLSVVRAVDFSTAKVLLLPSVQGTFPVNGSYTYGLAQLSRILHTKGLQNKEMELEYQTSSMGKLKMIMLDELYRSSRGLPVRGRSRFKDEDRLPPIKVIFPTDNHVYRSKLGEGGAGTICLKPEYWTDATFPRKVMHDFECVGNLKGSLMHSKIILAKAVKPPNSAEPVIPAQGAISALRHQDSNCVGWFYVGSANLSGSAWGTVANKKPAPKHPNGGLHIHMNNWELGVVYIIETEDEMHELAAISAAQRLDPSGEQSFFGQLPVPYKQPLTPYSFNDRPWFN